MGSTGARSSMYKNSGEEFNAGNGTTNFKGVLPNESGMVKPNSKAVTIQSGQPGKGNIIFQFTLSNDGKSMTVKAFNTQSKARVSVRVNSKHPSVSAVEQGGSASQKSKAAKMLKMMNESGQVSDASLPTIAGELLRRRKN